jgi:hypothetical protein
LTQIDLADFLAKPNYLCTCKMGWGAYRTVLDREKLLDDCFHWHRVCHWLYVNSQFLLNDDRSCFRSAIKGYIS